MPARTMTQSSTPSTAVDFDPSASTVDLLVARVEADPTAPLVARPDGDAWIEVSGEDFLAEVRALAKALLASGVAPGTHVGIFGRTSYEWTLVDYAVWYGGAISVPFYETSSVEQLTWMVADAEVDVVLTQSAEHSAKLAETGREFSLLVEFDRLAEFSATGTEVTDAELEASRDSLTGSSVATLIYTSGTTGRAKGCVLTHSNFVLTVQASTKQIAEVVNPDSRCLLFLPLAHVFARFIEVISVSNGVVLAHESDFTRLTVSLGSFRPTFILGVPRVFEKVFNSALAKAEAGGKEKIFRAAEAVAVRYSRALDEGHVSLWLKGQYSLFDKLVYSKLREVMGGRATYAVSGGGPLGEHLGHFFRGIGVNVLEGYGLTETTAPLTMTYPARPRIGAVGVPLPGNTVAIAPDGEVLARGVSVFREYWKNPEATAETFVDGWFRTGDIGSLDSEGYLRITGRKKELLVTSGGKNVAPAPLEDALRRHPIIGQPVLVGDGRKYISVLVFLDSEMLPTWLENQGLPPMSLAEAAVHPDVDAAVSKAVAKANAKVSTAESIKQYRILSVELTEDNGYLSAKQSVKRHLVNRDFAAVIDSIYED